MEAGIDSPIVGIDLGTTHSVVAVLENGQPRIIRNRLGEELTPSVVAVSHDPETIVVGQLAKNILAKDPSRATHLFKRHMGEDTKQTLGDTSLSPVQLSALVLGSLKDDAERDLGTEVSRAVVSVPAYFNDQQRFATIKAGELAGLHVERIINEPTAAAIAYGLNRRSDISNIATIDLGGGTFDVCIMDLFEGALEVKGTAGELFLGGEDFTQALVAEAAQRAGFVAPIDELPRELQGELLRKCEVAKKKVCAMEDAEFQIQEKTIRFTPDEADALFEPIAGRMVPIVVSALRGAGVGPSALDEVILVGGATRMPVVSRLITDFFQKEPLDGIDPDLAVAAGACIQAALIGRDEAVEDLVVVDVTSHSLGVETAREMAGNIVEGFFTIVVPRNTVLPTSRTQTLSTLEDNQPSVLLAIYEGESRRVKGNSKIGEIHVRPIPRGPRGVEVEVRMTYDLNGVLEVEATILATGKTFSTVLVRKSEGLSDVELERAKAHIQELKLDPLEHAQNRAVYSRGELLCEDLVGEERDILEGALASFEAAMASRNPKEIESAREQLEELCSRIEGLYRW